MRSVESAECGKCGVWKMRGVENEEHFNLNSLIFSLKRVFYNIVTLAC